MVQRTEKIKWAHKSYYMWNEVQVYARSVPSVAGLMVLLGKRL